MTTSTEEFLQQLVLLVRDKHKHEDHHPLRSFVESLIPDPKEPAVLRSEIIEASESNRVKSHVHQLKLLIQTKGITFGGQAIEDFKKVRKTKALEIIVRSPAPRPSVVKLDPTFAEITSYVETLKVVESAVLIQHCGEGGRSLCGMLLRRGATIDLFVQNPKTCVSKKQMEKLEGVHKQFDEHVNEDVIKGNGQLNIYRFDEPATIRAALIDKHILEVGWYTYHRSNNDGGARRGGRAEVDIKGHSRPMIIARHDEPCFPILRDELIMSVADRLRKTYKKPWRSVGGKKTND